MKKILSQKEVKNRLKNKGVILLSEYAGVEKEILCRCKCGKEFVSRAKQLLYRGKKGARGMATLVVTPGIELQMVLKKGE